MSNWNVEATKSSLDTSAALSGLQEGRNRTNDSFLSQVGDALTLNSYTQKEHTAHNPIGSYVDMLTFGLTDYSKEWGASWTTGYDIVGIKGSMVGPMRESIRSYVARVQRTLEDALGTNSEEVRKAIRGEDAIAEVNKYIDKVKIYCENVISALLVFSDKLADVGNAWNAAQQKAASTVSATTGAFSEGTMYTENIQYTGSK